MQHEYEFLARLVDPETGKNRDINIIIDGGRLAIQIDGYGDKYSVNGEGSPIVVDFYNNKLKVLVWADINKEDTTHSIDLDGAKEDKRVEKDSDGNCIYCGQKCYDGEMCDEQQAGGFNHNKVMETQDDA
jgi:hypothetical protein